MQDDVGDADMRSKMMHGGVELDGAMQVEYMGVMQDDEW